VGKTRSLARDRASTWRVAVALVWTAVGYLTLLGAGSAIADKGDCIQPITTGADPGTTDCLHILRTAVGSGVCSPVCICDPDASGGVTTGDALRCLRSVVGQSLVLNCPCERDTSAAEQACEEDCQHSLQVCGDELFFETHSSVGDCAEFCVDELLHHIEDAIDPDACYDAQVEYVDCCTSTNQCGVIPQPCDPEFVDAVEACDGSFSGCPLIFFFPED
jgi:hypothetical protein